MSLKVNINGNLVPKEEATVSVYDHGLLYGDGVFEGIRVYGGRVFLLAEHVERLYESARAIRLEIPVAPDVLSQRVEETVAANGLDDGYVRLVVTRGAGTLGLDIRRTSDPQVIVIADTISLYPQEIYEQGMKLVTASTIRNHPQALSPRIKSLNYLNNILAKIEGLQAGCVEALMLNHKGEVAECTGDNIFLVKLLQEII
jgi:branched-chain amino acid aminotransferase